MSPYITQTARTALRDRRARTAGELNYLITTLVNDYLGAHPDYQGYNDVMGALEGAKLELYRRRIAPYEDEKRAIYGDVYPTSDEEQPEDPAWLREEMRAQMKSERS